MITAELLRGLDKEKDDGVTEDEVEVGGDPGSDLPAMEADDVEFVAEPGQDHVPTAASGANLADLDATERDRDCDTDVLAEEFEDGDLPSLDGSGDEQEILAGPSGVNPENEAFDYIAGYLASKFRLKYPELALGVPTGQNPQWDIPIWIGAKSRGGLTVPSPAFRALLKEFDKVFDSIHGKELSYKKGAVKNLVAVLAAKFPDYPRKILLKYARTRLFTRMRYLNFLRREIAAAEAREKAKKRKALAGEKAASKKPVLNETARRRNRKKNKELRK